MATQASAIHVFYRRPGQGYLGGLGFVQIYFGLPIALIVIAAVFLAETRTVLRDPEKRISRRNLTSPLKIVFSANFHPANFSQLFRMFGPRRSCRGLGFVHDAMCEVLPMRKQSSGEPPARPSQKSRPGGPLDRPSSCFERGQCAAKTL